eukprot:jgi/Botrbrau1/13925/Bobra.136_2s0013.1
MSASREAKQQLIHALPKAELHLHVEGTLEPEMLLKIAERNGLMERQKLRTVEELQTAYDFQDLQSFLDLYYEGSKVLLKEADFYDLAYAYLKRAASEGVRHVEMFFDPQSHTGRGVGWPVFMGGLTQAITSAKAELGIQCHLIMCVMRDRGPESAMATLLESLAYKEDILGLGLDSTELGNPPAHYKPVYERARAEGYKLVAHCGEEGPAEFIWEALNELQIERVDHGVHCLDDPKLVAHLAQNQIPLTVCPLSNLKLKVYEGVLREKMDDLVRSDMLITINSDDPAYFQGYINANYELVDEMLDLSTQELKRLAANSFKASFLSEEAKAPYLEEVEIKYREVVGARMEAGLTASEAGALQVDEGETLPPLEVPAAILA